MKNNKPDIEQFTNLDMKGLVLNQEMIESSKTLVGIYIGLLQGASERTDSSNAAAELADHIFINMLQAYKGK